MSHIALPPKSWWLDVARRSLPFRVLWLTAAFVSVWLPIQFLSWFVVGPSTLTAGFVAVLFCWLAGVLSLIFSELLKGDELAVWRVGCGILIRTFGLLVVCIIVQQQAVELIQSGFLAYMLIFYFLGLTLETVLMVSALQSIS
jgi:hypothetical protein